MKRRLHAELTSASTPSILRRYAGHLCPHQSCLEMHQSCIEFIHRYQSASSCLGPIFISPALVRCERAKGRERRAVREMGKWRQWESAKGRKDENSQLERRRAGVERRERTLMASAARGWQLTHHWGFMTASMMSPDLLWTLNERRGGSQQANRVE